MTKTSATPDGRGPTSDVLADDASWWERLLFEPTTAFDLALTRILVFGVAAGWFLEALVRGRPAQLAGLALSWDPVSFLSLLAVPAPAQPWATVLWVVASGVCLAACLGIGGRPVVATAGIVAAITFTIPESYGKINHFQNIAAMGVLVLATARPGPSVATLVRGRPINHRSWRHRWPVVTVQLAVASMYVNAGVSKLMTSGWAWIDGPNMRNVLAQELLLYRTSVLSEIGLSLAAHPVLWKGVAAVTILVEVGMVLAVVGPRRWIRQGAALAGAGLVVGLNLVLGLGGRVPVVLALAFVEWERITDGPTWRRWLVPLAFTLAGTVNVVSHGAPRHALVAVVPGLVATLVMLSRPRRTHDGTGRHGDPGAVGDPAGTRPLPAG